MDDSAVEAVRRRAAQLVVEPSTVGPLVATRGSVADPHPILDPAGRHERWFVPVVVDDALAGFFVLGFDLVVHRWSTFQRHPDSLDGCPLAADWLDPEVIAARAVDVAGATPTGPPVLGYDGVPDRIAWVVPVGDRRVYVAGTAAWIATKGP